MLQSVANIVEQFVSKVYTQYVWILKSQCIHARIYATLHYNMSFKSFSTVYLQKVFCYASMKLILSLAYLKIAPVIRYIF